MHGSSNHVRIPMDAPPPLAVTTAPRSVKSRWRRWRHAVARSLRGVLRLEDTPHRIALGSAFGLFFAFQPAVGSQMLVAAAGSRLAGANVIASLPWTWISNPLTMLPLWWATYCLGCAWWPSERELDLDRLRDLLDQVGAAGLWSLLGGGRNDLWPLLIDVFVPMQLGSLALGAICAAVGYLAVRRLVLVVQRRRLLRRATWRAQADPPPSIASPTG